mgnify:CR=1 FL=1
MQTVLHRKSATLGKVPQALELGEIAVGFAAADPVLWLRDTNDQVVRVTKRIATQAEVDAGVSTDTIVTPRTLARLLEDFRPGNGNNKPDGGNAEGIDRIDGAGADAVIDSYLDGGAA